MTINKAITPLTAYLLIASLTCVNAQSTATDSLKLSKMLDEIVISAPECIVAGNKTIYIPERRLTDAVNSTIQLLAGIQLPELTVNMTTGNINISGGGKLSIRINGRPASERDLALVSPKQIARIEYINNPGIRYGDAEGVLNITVKRPATSGYSIFANLLQSPNRGWGDYTVAIKHNIGKSEWSIDYHSNPMWDMDCYRDNRENFILPDGKHVTREETGIKTPNRMVTHRGALQYSYAEGNSMLLNVQARLLYTDDYYHTTGSIITSSEAITSLTIEDETNPIKSIQTDLDLYFHKRIGKKQNIYLNIVPTLIESKSSHQYITDMIDITNRSYQKGHRLSMEGIWEYRLDTGTLSTGIRSNYRSDRLQHEPAGTILHERLSQNDLLAEWRHSGSIWQYEAGVALTYITGSSTSGKKVALNPRASLHYRFSDHGSAGLYFESSSVTPGVNDVSPTLQRVDRYQWSQGSERLSPYLTYTAKGEFNFKLHNVTAKITVSNSYADNPIMTAKRYCDDMIVQSPYNAGYNNHFDTHAMLRLPLFSGHLSLTAEGGWHRFDSKGINYRHSYSQPYVNLQLMLLLKSWWFMAKYNNSYNRLWGETITSANQNLTNLGIGYTYKSITLSGGGVNPLGNVALRSRDLSKIAGYDRIYQATGSNTLIWGGITINLRHGKKRVATQKKLDNDYKYESITNAKK